MKDKIGYLTIGFFFLILNLTPVPKYIRNIAYTFLSPFTTVLNRAYLTSTHYISSYANTGNLIHENEILRSKVLELEKELLIVTEEKENTQLKDFYKDYYGFNEESVLTANVLEFFTQDDSRFVTINKGEKDGVVKGDTIVIQSTLLGHVHSTSINTSSVKLIDSPNTQIPVKISGKNTFGSFSCMQNCIVEKIPIQDDVEIGDLVITSGSNGIYLPSLSIGLITAINVSPASAFRSANVSYQIVPSKLYKVVVLSKND